MEQALIMAPEQKEAIEFTCSRPFESTIEDFVAQIFELPRWPAFKGYGPLPGIEKAEFEVFKPGYVGTRIKVKNTDGSQHIEEVTSWDGTSLTLQMKDFSPPVSRLSSHFEEQWNFKPISETKILVERCFRLYPHNTLTALLLKGIAILLKKAVDKHLSQMSDKH